MSRGWRISLFAAVLMMAGGTVCVAADSPPRVVASIKPIHALVAGVMRGVAAPELLLDDQQSPHHFALKPSQARLLQQADMVFWVDQSLETPMAKLLSNLAPQAQNIRLMAQAEWVLHENAIMDEHHYDDAEHEDHAEHGDHADHAAMNPHIWLDLDNARRLVQVIAAQLSASDPAHAEIYASNAAELDKRLADLHAAAKQQMVAVRESKFIVQHDAFIYIERQFDLSRGLVIAVDHDTPPGTAHLQTLRNIVASGAVSCVFDEPQGNAHQIDIVAGEVAVRRATLDAIGVNRPAGPELYFDMMRANYAAFVACLGGAG